MTSHEAVVQLIAATRSGPAIRAELKATAHPTGIKITDAQIARLPLEEHGFHGEWNYTLRARYK
jgi:hypothetical protein